MVGIGFQDSEGFFADEAHQLGIGAKRPVTGPQWAFDLKKDAYCICSQEGAFWRAPRMEPNVVDTELFNSLKESGP